MKFFLGLVLFFLFALNAMAQKGSQTSDVGVEIKQQREEVILTTQGLFECLTDRDIQLEKSICALEVRRDYRHCQRLSDLQEDDCKERNKNRGFCKNKARVRESICEENEKEALKVCDLHFSNNVINCLSQKSQESQK